MVKTVNYWVPNLTATGLDDATLQAGIARAKENGCKLVAFIDNTAYNKDPFGHIEPHVVAMAKASS